ncbi:MAG: hypothetical protein LBM71_03200 [Elusimicrobiota bacterium]|nr:hypothetical protein [Elusimicrobiota bacterium]
MKKDTLFNIEILVAALLIALLLGFSVKKVIKLQNTARTSVSQRNLNKLRDALSVYRGDHEGLCPLTLQELAPDYIEKIPQSYNQAGDKSSKVITGSFNDAFDGSGGWVFVSDPRDGDYCSIFLNSN